MADNPTFLNRWSRRKHEAARATQAPAEAAPAPPALPVAQPAAEPAPVVPVTALPVEPSLPPVESLTLASDFKPFLSAKVDEAVKRAALRKLFTDPHFNVMDGLDTYIGDYSKPDPMPEGLLDRLADVYKTLEEKVAEATPSEAVQEAPQTDAEPSAATDQDTDERQG